MSDVIFWLVIFIFVINILFIIVNGILIYKNKDAFFKHILSIFCMTIFLFVILFASCLVYFCKYQDFIFNDILKEIIDGNKGKIYISFFIGVVTIIITFIICLVISFSYLLKVMYKHYEDETRKKEFIEKYVGIIEVEDKTKNKEKKDKQSIRTLNIKGVINVKENPTIPVSDEERS